MVLLCPRDRSHVLREAYPSITQPSPEEEFLCDVGAAELTMPLERFRREMEGQALSLGSSMICMKSLVFPLRQAGRRALHTTDETACLFVAALARRRIKT